MRVAVIGAGGVGGYFGARLAQCGQDVAFVARGVHLEAIRTHGLHVRSPEGDVHLAPVEATDDPGAVGPVDVVLVAVKAWQLEDAARLMRPLLDADTAVVPLLNGVDAPDVLAHALGAEHVLGGLCGIAAHIEGPGRITHVGGEPSIRFGELDNAHSPRVMALRGAFEQAGVVVEVPADIRVAMWQKFLFIAPLSGIASVARVTFGVMQQMPELRGLVEQATREAFAVGLAEGVGLTQAHLEAALGMLDWAPAAGTPSMQRDIEAGRPSELEAQTGAIVRRGARHTIATPVNDVLYTCLLPQERRARGATAV